MKSFNPLDENTPIQTPVLILFEKVVTTERGTEVVTKSEKGTFKRIAYLSNRLVLSSLIPNQPIDFNWKPIGWAPLNQNFSTETL